MMLVRVVVLEHSLNHRRTLAEFTHTAQVVRVHTENVVKVMEVSPPYLSRQAIHGDTPRLRRRTHSAIWRIACMPTARSRRVDFELIKHPGFIRVVPEDRLGHWASADIPHTHKQNFDLPITTHAHGPECQVPVRFAARVTPAPFAVHAVP